jgi:hypothetical protein
LLATQIKICELWSQDFGGGSNAKRGAAQQDIKMKVHKAG